MNKKVTFIAFIALTLLASGCTGNTEEPQADQETPEDTNLTASEWCQQNDNGEAVREGCTAQEDLLGNVSGQAYYAANNPQINCEDPEAYVCEE
jgi:hypothetical protein